MNRGDHLGGRSRRVARFRCIPDNTPLPQHENMMDSSMCFLLLMRFIYWQISIFSPANIIQYFEDHIILTSGCMWRMWMHSRGRDGSVFVLTSSSVLSSQSDSETDEKKKSKGTLSKQ